MNDDASNEKKIEITSNDSEIPSVVSKKNSRGVDERENIDERIEKVVAKDLHNIALEDDATGIVAVAETKPQQSSALAFFLKVKSKIGTFDSLTIRDYRLLFLGQCCTSTGQWMDQVTRGWLIYDMTHDATQLGIATACRGLPLLIFGVLAGAVADRYSRIPQLIIAQTSNAVLNCILATLVITHTVQPWHVFVSGFLVGTVQAFQQPARQTLVSDVVGAEKLLNALALNSAALNGSRAVGPAIAGALIAWIGVAGSYYVQAAMFVVATIWTFQIKPPARSGLHHKEREKNFFASIRGGFAFVAHEPTIRTQLMLALGPLTFGMSYISMMPMVARDALHGDAATQGLLLSCVGGGALAGALIVASLRRQFAYGLPVVIGAVCFSLSVCAFATSPFLALSCVLAVIVGASMVSYQTQNQTLLQLSAPKHIRGRVMSIYLLNRGTVPIGALIAGAIASSLGAQHAIQIMAGIAFLIILVVVSTHPQILRIAIPLKDKDKEKLSTATATATTDVVASTDDVVVNIDNSSDTSSARNSQSSMQLLIDDSPSTTSTLNELAQSVLSGDVAKPEQLQMRNNFFQ